MWVDADKIRIMQVRCHLLENAIKFRKGGNILVQLMKKTSEDIADDNPQVIVSITDEGPGIDPSIIPRLFTKFATTSEKGAGLGLFISKGIIEAHGGKIWTQNNVLLPKRRGEENGARGATFSFSLPINW